jgi:hypothetical protein
MAYRTLADLVLALHLAFIVFVVAGGLLAMRWRLAPLVHLPALLWGVWIEVSGGLCPLTPLENVLRRTAGASGYSGGFIEQYLVPAIYPAALTHSFQLLLAGLVVLTNVCVYWLVWRQRTNTRVDGTPDTE